MMYELVYTSAARRMFDPKQLGSILEIARINNAKLSVSGILLYDAGSFLQVLEGEEAAVQGLFEKIARDDRHERIKVMQRRAIEKRSFSEWSMGFVSLDSKLMREFPKRHGLSGNGSLEDQSSAVLALLDAFRNGRFRSYILG